ncbi:acetyltransferase [Rhizobium wenxiniae]|uniref:GNAT superfamily N-acetyltransferase n=1 Tax=Rhizobium wenxiniae TaxID=1737357 RepID=A0A7X0D0E3_9HYPH|nr:GNAT family N-acetyltransferase [Rhizobium wenxiniae]MBB6163317.1 GNAT superfamily N-acetyltransferase [Rhizobium wenxiniae]GGF91815.1 acetyltransferase [Rhizobium wenxiniae]
MSEAVIRVLDLAEIEALLGWAKAEGWNPGLADAAPFQAADPQGFIGCFVDGVMAAGISAVRYGSTFGFIGLYIAHPDFRGRGYGKRVWDAGMAHLAGRTIGLDGVPEQQANYRSMGFMPDYETFRWSGTLEGRPHSEICTFDAVQLPALIEFDRRYFAERRPEFLLNWPALPRQTKVFLRNGVIAGYAVVRQCHEGYKIGPILAADFGVARDLLFSCAIEARGEVLHIDVPAGQIEFSTLLDREGFARGFRTSRMYRGTQPSFDTAGVFAVTTLELG